MAGVPPLGRPWIDGTHFVLGRNFLNFWIGGRSVFGADNENVGVDVRHAVGLLGRKANSAWPE